MGVLINGRFPDHFERSLAVSRKIKLESALRGFIKYIENFGVYYADREIQFWTDTFS